MTDPIVEALKRIVQYQGSPMGNEWDGPSCVQTALAESVLTLAEHRAKASADADSKLFTKLLEIEWAPDVESAHDATEALFCLVLEELGYTRSIAFYEKSSVLRCSKG